MSITIDQAVWSQIQRHLEAAYPEEGAGLLLGHVQPCHRQVVALLPLVNSREAEVRHNRYLISAQDMLRAEQEAESRDLNVIGVFHSHPDHSDHPSEFDREWALPWFSYVITSVVNGGASGGRSWRLREDRSAFDEEQIEILEGTSPLKNECKE